MMMWNEMSLVQKVLFVLAWACMTAWFVLAILGELGIFEGRYINHILLAVWCLGTGIAHKSKIMRIFWFVLAAAYVILSVLTIFS